MLSKGKISSFVLVSILLFGCISSPKEQPILEKEKQYNKTVNQIMGSSIERENLYHKISDTLKSWLDADLYGINKLGYSLLIDSIFCVNSEGNKLIGAQLRSHGVGKFSSDGIEEFFGAKVNNKWYFWTGGYQPVIRRAYKNHDIKKPLSYKQLHQEAMRSFLGGYLTKEGKINDDWFEFKFREGRSYFKDRYEYKWLLDGQRIDNEKDYYEYLWKKKGLSLWIAKFARDSVDKLNKTSAKPTSREQQTEIGMAIARKMMANE